MTVQCGGKLPFAISTASYIAVCSVRQLAWPLVPVCSEVVIGYIACRDLRIAAVTGELAGTNLTQATGEQVLKMQQALQNQGVPGLSAEQLGVVRDNIWNQHWQAQLQSQQQQPILAGCV